MIKLTGSTVKKIADVLYENREPGTQETEMVMLHIVPLGDIYADVKIAKVRNSVIQFLVRALLKLDKQVSK